MAPRHAAKASRRRRRVTVLVAVGVVVLAAGIVTTVALVPTATTAPSAGAAVHGPLHVAAISPGGAWVSPDARLHVTFNNPIKANSPMPTITPRAPGEWVQLSPMQISFRANAPMTPGRTYRVVIPANTTSTAGTTLKVAVARRFTVAVGSTLRLHQLLAELGYLPLRFVPTGGQFSATSTAVQRGTFTWRWGHVPPGLTALWQPNVYTTITKGAIMRFEDASGLPTVGDPTMQVWNALLAAVAAGKHDPSPYEYVDVNTALPQTLTLYVNMKPIYSTLINSGISSRPSAIETDPVYLRYLTTTMSGTNPDGSHYNDPGIPWVSYFHGGEALHGYIRGSYGWPQSLGCIEMPYDHAKSVFPYTPIGTLVTVR